MAHAGVAGANTSNARRVEEFIDAVKWIYEPEYGDFKRKMSLYLKRLQEHLGDEGMRPEVASHFSKIMAQVVYQPSGEVESTRAEVLNWALDLKAMIRN